MSAMVCLALGSYRVNGESVEGVGHDAVFSRLEQGKGHAVVFGHDRRAVVPFETGIKLDGQEREQQPLLMCCFLRPFSASPVRGRCRPPLVVHTVAWDTVDTQAHFFRMTQHGFQVYSNDVSGVPSTTLPLRYNQPYESLLEVGRFNCRQDTTRSGPLEFGVCVTVTGDGGEGGHRRHATRMKWHVFTVKQATRMINLMWERAPDAQARWLKWYAAAAV